MYNLQLSQPPLLLKKRNLLQSQIQAKKDRRRRKLLGEMAVPYRKPPKSRNPKDE